MADSTSKTELAAPTAQGIAAAGGGGAQTSFVHGQDSRRDRELSLSALQVALVSFDLEKRAGLQLIVNHCLQLFEASGAAIALAEEGAVICVASAGMAPNEGAILTSDSGLSDECFRTGNIVDCKDIHLDPRVSPALRETPGLRSMMVLPLRDSQGILGIFEILSSHPNQFKDDDISALQQICQLSVEIARGKAQPGRPTTASQPSTGAIISVPRSKPDVAASPNETFRSSKNTLQLNSGMSRAANFELSDFLPDTLEMLTEIASELNLVNDGALDTVQPLTPPPQAWSSKPPMQVNRKPNARHGVAKRRVNRGMVLLKISMLFLLILLVLAVFRGRVFGAGKKQQQNQATEVRGEIRDKFEVLLSCRFMGFAKQRYDA